MVIDHHVASQHILFAELLSDLSENKQCITFLLKKKSSKEVSHTGIL